MIPEIKRNNPEMNALIIWEFRVMITGLENGKIKII